MSNRIRVILLSEINSKLGSPFLALLAGHPDVDLVGVVTSRPGRLCSYFVHDSDQVDLEAQAREIGVRVFRPVDVNAPEMIDTLVELRPDYLIVGNYQQILKPALLRVPAVTAVNFHPSPLPRYAGLAPFFWMVRNGEREGGVTAIEVDAGVDTGPIIMQRRMRLTGRETAVELRGMQERENVRMLAELIPRLADRSFTTTPQNPRERSYFGRPRPADYLINFDSPAEDIRRIVRAGYRHPGAHTFRSDGARIVLLSLDDSDIGVRLPLARTGTVRRVGGAWLVAATDTWLRIRTIENQGAEVRVDQQPGLLPDGVTLGARVPEEVAG
ncbi:formyl transferase [Nocardia terpenica]|uniref:methionyl-tRNA formyltransferase n=1 Tax=Nocardia terpenica TaxID=455432 RepID=UPI002FE2EB37